MSGKMIRGLLCLAGLFMDSWTANVGRNRAFSNNDDILTLFREAEDYDISDDVLADNCNWGDDYRPTEIEINKCIEAQKLKRCKGQFDTSVCSDQICLLGYETDSEGCAVSCQCKNNGLFEGDIIVQEEEIPLLMAEYGLASQPKGASKERKRWKDYRNGNYYEVPYVFDCEIRVNPHTVEVINEAMDEYARQTCIRFRKRTTEANYLKFYEGEGCGSHVGMQRGAQPISIGKRCASKGIVMHEIMHAMGFFHEQSRPDRDKFVKIITQNIIRTYLWNFKKMSYSVIDSMGSPYDINSLMHYGGYFFTKKRGMKTVVDRKTGLPVVAQRDGFTAEDRKQINMMYGCPGYN